MENDILKNKIAPWQEKGRWYHGVFDFSTGDFIKDKTDPEWYANKSVLNNGGYYYIGFDPSKPEYKIIDCHFYYDGVTIGTANPLSGGIHIATNGAVRHRIGFTTFLGGKAEVWVFAYKK